MKAEISDRDLGSSRGVNIVLPRDATAKPYTWRDDTGHWVSGIRIEPLCRADVRELGEALIEAAREHAEECHHHPDTEEYVGPDD